MVEVISDHASEAIQPSFMRWITDLLCSCIEKSILEPTPGKQRLDYPADFSSIGSASQGCKKESDFLFAQGPSVCIQRALGICLHAGCKILVSGNLVYDLCECHTNLLKLGGCMKLFPEHPSTALLSVQSKSIPEMYK
jgi:hypothetical protein